MADGELQLLVESISSEVFNKPFLHSARYNKRLRTTGGRYMLMDHAIEVNPLVLNLHGFEELVDVIKHELCHYHLHIEGRGYKHRDVDFKVLLKQTASPRFCKPLAKRNRKPITLHIYECKSCKLKYKRQRRMNITRYRCGKCTGQIMKI